MAVRIAKLRFGLVGIIATFVYSVPGQMARSEGYSLDYAIVGSATAVTTSANHNYEITGLVATYGIAGGMTATSNSNYTISPLVGESLAENTSVKFWSLY